MSSHVRSGQIHHIQILRAISVIAIVGFHSSINPIFPGYLGVDIFFVISGFVITPKLLPILNADSFRERVKESYEFLGRRFYRLAPALGIFLLVSSLFLFLLLNIDDHARTWKQAIASLLILGNFGAYRFSGDYFSPTPNAYIHTWSLAVEEQIYVALPIALMMIWFRRKSSYLTLLIILFLSSAVLFTSKSLNESINEFLGFNYASKLGIDFYSPFHRFWEFALGSLIYLVSSKSSRQKHYRLSWPLPFAISILILVPFISLESRFLTWIVCIVAGVYLACGNTQTENWLSKSLVLIGNKSYSIYLVHMPISVIVLSNTEIRELNPIITVILIFSLTWLFSRQLYKSESRFRVVGELPKRKNIATGIFKFTIVPLLFFSFMHLSLNARYFGLDRNPSAQVAAWSLDPNCDRNNSPVPCIGLPTLPRKTLLIGDSTSGAISEVVTKSSLENSLQTLIWSRGGCQFTTDYKSDFGDVCAKHNLEVINFIKKTRPEVTLVSNLVTNPAKVSGISQAILLIKPYTKIIIVGQVPVFPDAGKYQKRNSILTPIYEAPKVFKLSSMQKPFLSSNLSLLIKSRELGVPYINIWDTFCNEDFCNRYKNGWLYFDNSHLNTTGADLLRSQISNEIKNTLSKN